MAQLVKNPPAMWETWVQSLGWEDPLETGKATHSQYSGLEYSMDCCSPWGCEKSNTDEQLSLSYPKNYSKQPKFQKQVLK